MIQVNPAVGPAPPGAAAAGHGGSEGERKFAAQALPDESSRLRLMVEQLPAFIWSTDTELRVTSLMGAGLAALNVDPAKNVGMTLFEYFRTDDPDFPHIVPHRRALHGESQAYTGEWMGRAYKMYIEPLYEGGRIIGCIGVALDVTDLKAAESAVQDYAQRLQTLSRRLLDVQEQERRHLARELHDEIGQVLSGLKLTLDMSSRLEGDELRAGLASAQVLVKDLAARVRDLSLCLRPSMLDDLGLLPALLWHIERYTAQTRIHVACEHSELAGRFDPEVETAAYRIVQEALTNVARHARTDRASVRVWLEHQTLHVLVEDPGGGFDVDAVRTAAKSSGLSGMEERAVLLGGRLSVESRIGAGTRVVAELPVNGEPAR